MCGKKCIGCVMISMHTLNAVDSGFESGAGQTKDYKRVFVASSKNVG